MHSVRLACASKYIIDIWRTYSVACKAQKWPLALFEGLTIVLVSVRSAWVTSRIHNFLFLKKSLDFRLRHMFPQRKQYVTLKCWLLVGNLIYRKIEISFPARDLSSSAVYQAK